ncbi:hypothetical protein ACLMJK_007005 [Lecanora helva]
MADEKLKKQKFGYVPTVTLIVGPDKVPFIVHKTQLCEASSFFKAAFHTTFYKEGSENKMQLAEDKASTVDLFVQWLYKKECELSISHPRNQSSTTRFYMKVVKLLIFADKYDVPSFKEYMLQMFLDHCHDADIPWLPKLYVIEFVYDNTCPGSGLRRLLIDTYTAYSDEEWYQSRRVRQKLCERPVIAVDLLTAATRAWDEEEFVEIFKRRTPKHYLGMTPEAAGMDEDSESGVDGESSEDGDERGSEAQEQSG